MKNACTFLFVFLFAFGSAIAQEDFQKFKFGFELDPNISWFKSKENDLISQGPVARIGGGLNADIFFAPNYALGTGFYIRTRGGQVQYRTTFQDSEGLFITQLDRTFNTKFIEIPLTFKLKTDEIGYITYYGQFGIGLGFSIGASGSETYRFESVFNEDSNAFERSDRAGIEEENINFNNEVASLRTSMIIGAGIEYSLAGSTAVKVGLTFNNGFTNGIANNTNGVSTAKGSDDVLITQDSDGLNRPQTFELNAVSNSISLNIGILF